MDPKDRSQKPGESKPPKDLREANENIRKAQDEGAPSPADDRKTGNKPAFDRDR